MSGAAAGAIVAAAAAAAARRAREEEEEHLTGYTPNDLAEGWEFKILRSASGAFKKPDVMRQALEEESRAGWVLLEKLDNRRLRLKRPSASKSADASLGFDPYRTQFGISDAAQAAIIMGSILSVIAITMLLVFMLTRH